MKSASRRRSTLYENAVIREHVDACREPRREFTRNKRKRESEFRSKPSSVHEARSHHDEAHGVAELSEEEAASLAEHVAEAQIEEEAREAQHRVLCSFRRSPRSSPDRVLWGV